MTRWAVKIWSWGTSKCFALGAADVNWMASTHGFWHGCTAHIPMYWWLCKQAKEQTHEINDIFDCSDCYHTDGELLSTMICSRQCCASWSRWDTIEKDQILNLAQGPITEWYIWAASWIHVAGTEVAHVDELSWRQSTVRLLQTQHMALSKASGGPPDRHGRKCMVLKLHIDFSLDIVWSRVLGPA